MLEEIARKIVSQKPFRDRLIKLQEEEKMTIIPENPLQMKDR